MHYFILTALCVLLGRSLSETAARHSNKLSLIGAAVLMIIGIKILVEHDVFAGLL